MDALWGNLPLPTTTQVLFTFQATILHKNRTHSVSPIHSFHKWLLTVYDTLGIPDRSEAFIRKRNFSAGHLPTRRRGKNRERRKQKSV